MEEMLALSICQLRSVWLRDYQSDLAHQRNEGIQGYKWLEEGFTRHTVLVIEGLV